MPAYRCYFMDKDRHISSVEDLVCCADEAQAGRIAREMLVKRHRHYAAEVWDGDRRVSRHLRGKAWS